MKKFFLFFVLACALILSSCGGNGSTLDAISSGAIQNTESAEAEPAHVLRVPDALPDEPWALTASNPSLGVEVSLMDFGDSIPLDYVTTTTAGGDEILYVSIKNDFAWKLDSEGRICYMDLGEGWNFLSKFSIPCSKDKLIELYDVDPYNGMFFNKDGSIADDSKTADASVYFSGLGNVIDTFLVSTTHQLPTPILVADDICEIYSCSPSKPNSADGVDATISFSNKSDRTIKYIIFSVTPYNAVDDPVSSKIGNKSTASLKLTGPIEPTTAKGDCSSATWDTVWYNPTIRSCKIDAVTIEYMDGEVLEIPVV